MAFKIFQSFAVQLWGCWLPGSITFTTQGQRRNEPTEFGGQIVGSWGEVIENLDLRKGNPPILLAFLFFHGKCIYVNISVYYGTCWELVQVKLKIIDLMLVSTL